MMNTRLLHLLDSPALFHSKGEGSPVISTAIKCLPCLRNTTSPRSHHTVQMKPKKLLRHSGLLRRNTRVCPVNHSVLRQDRGVPTPSSKRALITASTRSGKETSTQGQARDLAPALHPSSLANQQTPISPLQLSLPFAFLHHLENC